MLKSFNICYFAEVFPTTTAGRCVSGKLPGLRTLARRQT